MSTNSERITRRYLWIAARVARNRSHRVDLRRHDLRALPAAGLTVPATAADALVKSSMASKLRRRLSLLSRLPRLPRRWAALRTAPPGDDIVPRWLSSCIAGSVVAYVAVTISTGFAAERAALYDGHQARISSTVTTVNDIRNLGFILCAGLVGLRRVGRPGRQGDRRAPRWSRSAACSSARSPSSASRCTPRRHRCVDDALLRLVRRRRDRGPASLPPPARPPDRCVPATV